MSNIPSTVSAQPKQAITVVRGGRQRKLLTEPILFEEQSLPGFVRAGLFSAAILLVLFIVWASLVHIDEVATAPGQIVPTGSVKVIQHLEGGVVGEVLVQEGQKVEEGQVLIKMDPAPARSELEQMRARSIGLQLRSERLKATIDGRQPDFTAISDEFPDLVNDQQRLWSGQLAAQASALSVIDSQLDQKRREVKQLREALQIAEQQYKLTSDQVEIRRKAVESGVVSKQVYLETARAKVTAEGEVTRLKEQIQVNTDGLSEFEKRRQNLGATQRQDALAELGTVSAELEQVKGSMTKLQDRFDRLEVKAPVQGLVQDLKVRTQGEVVAAGAILMRVVPTQDALEAEVHISTADVGHVKIGQTVKIKVSSYDYNRYGTLGGVLDKVSPTTQLDETGKTPFYKGIIKIARPFVGPVDGVNPVMPGMGVEADIVTGDKVLIEYLFKPVFVSLKSAFHER